MGLNARMKQQATPPAQNAQNGLRRSVKSPRRMSKSTPLSQAVQKNPGNSVLLPAADLFQVLKNATTKFKLLSKMPPKKIVPWNPSALVSLSQNWCQSLNQNKNVWTSRRRSVHVPELIQG